MACGPRACGGGPVMPAARAAVMLWSPRVRGWSRLHTSRVSSLQVVPARAGVVPGRRAWARGARCGPRACGGGPRSTAAAAPSLRRSPRAGVVPLERNSPNSWRSGPRACGGGPSSKRLASLPGVWSPRVREWSHRPAREAIPGPAVPARAGVAPGMHGWLRAPRQCGAWKTLTMGPVCLPRVCGPLITPHATASPITGSRSPQRAMSRLLDACRRHAPLRGCLPGQWAPQCRRQGAGHPSEAARLNWEARIARETSQRSASATQPTSVGSTPVSDAAVGPQGRAPQPRSRSQRVARRPGGMPREPRLTTRRE